MIASLEVDAAADNVDAVKEDIYQKRRKAEVTAVRSVGVVPTFVDLRLGKASPSGFCIEMANWHFCSLETNTRV
ncbi:hypothetical protein N7540_006891 [Penicillium herquei]|nr:hypothetical protein N7540_006891 [Penicillium herquei]